MQEQQRLRNDEIPCPSCGAPVKRLAVLCMRCGVRVPSSVLNVGMASDAGVPPASDRRQDTREPPVVLALLYACAGGFLGIVAALQAELSGSLFVVAPLILAPVAEEILKPIGVYLLAFKWPGVLRRRWYVASLAALSGLMFAIVESAVYTLVYFPEQGQNYVLYRFTVPLAIHSGASFLFGLGINSNLANWLRGRASLNTSNWPFFVAAIGVHAVYNGTVIALETIESLSS